MTLAFPDTNILIYAFSGDPRSEVARDIITNGGVLSVQSLNEFTSVARRKLAFDWDDVREAISALLTYLPIVIGLDLELQADAIRLAERYRLSIYDAQIAAAALRGGCDTLYSEDMHSGLTIDDRLVIRNPFV